MVPAVGFVRPKTMDRVSANEMTTGVTVGRIDRVVHGIGAPRSTAGDLAKSATNKAPEIGLGTAQAVPIGRCQYRLFGLCFVEAVLFVPLPSPHTV